MPKASCKFRISEVFRACRGVEQATGKKVARVEIDQAGKIIVFPGGDDKTDTALRNNERDQGKAGIGL